MNYKTLLKYYQGCTEYDTMKKKKLLELYKKNCVLKCGECGGGVFMENSYTCKVCLEQLSGAFDKEK